MRPVRMTLFLTLLLLAGPQMAACAELTPAYAIKESDFRAAEEVTPVWVDNNKVMFTGYQVEKGGQGKLSDRVTDYKAEVFIWDTSENTITKYSEQGRGRFCVHDGVVSFLRFNQMDKTWDVTSERIEGGPKEKKVLSEKHWFNPFNCRYYDSRPYWAVEGRETHPLLEEHGYLDWGVALSPPTQGEYYKNTPITFFSSGGKEGIRLPVGRREASKNIYYAAFNNAYLLYALSYVDKTTGREEAVGVWPKGVPLPVWWLAPNGKVTKVDIPYMPLMNGGSRGFYPTRSGIFMFSHQARDLGDPGEAGGYLVQGQVVKKLITGMLWKTAVSPDGCKVAVVHDTYDKKPKVHRTTLKIVDVCKGR